MRVKDFLRDVYCFDWVTCALVVGTVFAIGAIVHSAVVIDGKSRQRDECPAVVPPGTGAWLCMPPGDDGVRRWRKVEGDE